MAKISFIGAGSVVFNKNLLGDILLDPTTQDSIISLHDIDPVRLETAEILARRLAESLGANPKIEAHLDRRRSLEGANYVINLIGIGGHAATLIDFEIPKQYGLRQTIGDTHGVGGIFRALRTVPVLREIVRDMEIYCPQALLINYSNPMSILMWAIHEISPIRSVGLCHSVQGTVRQLTKYTNLPFAEVSYLGAGINHMSWILRFEHQGKNAYPLLDQAIEQGFIPRTDLVRADLYKRLGYYVTESSEHLAEYLPYYIPHAGQVEALNIPLDEYVRRSARGLKEFDELRTKLLRGDPLEVRHSAEYASQIIHSMETGQSCVIYGNVRNDGLIENLPQGCIVEVPCLVDRNGLQPTHIGSLPPHLAALNRQQIGVHELAVKAALEGDRRHIYRALMLDPLASASLTLDQMEAMVDEMIAAHGPAMPEGLRMVKSCPVIIHEPEPPNPAMLTN